MVDLPNPLKKEEKTGDGILKGLGIASLWGSSFLLSSVNEILGVVIKRNSADSNLVATAKGLTVAIGLGVAAIVTRFFALDRSYDSIKDTNQVKWLKEAGSEFFNLHKTDTTLAKDAGAEQQAHKDSSQKTL